MKRLRGFGCERKRIPDVQENAGVHGVPGRSAFDAVRWCHSFCKSDVSHLEQDMETLMQASWAQDIVTELMISLDLDQVRLQKIYQLYSFICELLVEANIKKM